jgi:undecaprenyl diphosphate synthase
MKELKHVAIIMDGNRRWAEQHGLTLLEGYSSGAERMRSTGEHLAEYQVKYMTVYGFSTENWNRPPGELEVLFHLFTEMLNKNSPEMNRRGVRLRHLGRLDGLPPAMKMALQKAVELTSENTGITINLAVNYGGRQEILDALNRIVKGVSLSAAIRLIDEEATLPQIDESVFSNYLYTDGIPDIDLLIRTGGELRLSNFLIWQSAYSEYYFTDVLWPDFDEVELDKALLAYNQRQRRFGGD